MGGYKRRLGPDATAGGDAIERELDEELQAHLAMRTDELVARGMSPEAARAEAVRRLGGEERARRRLLAGARRVRRRRWLRESLAGVAADVRMAVRHARRAPGFAAVAVLIFAGGVGLTTTMFTVADNVLLRPLPFPEPERLVALWSVEEQGNAFPWVSMANWVDWREGATALDGTALYSSRPTSVATADDVFPVETVVATGAYFTTLRNDFVLGRSFTEEEAEAGAPLAVVSEGFWTRVLGGATDLRGVSVVVDGQRRDVVGVVPTAQAFPSGTELFLPTAYRAGSGALRNNINWEVVARMAPGASTERLRSELDAVARTIRESDPEAVYSWGVGVRPLQGVVVRDARTTLIMLSVAVGFLLLLACANLAGLSLARARRRASESAVHLALGAGPGRLVRRALTEHVLLALVGGALGVLAAALSIDVLLGRAASVIPRAAEVQFDFRVAGFGIAAALLAGLVAGALPALAGSRGSVAGAMAGARGGVASGRGLPGAVMVGTEIALAMTLLVAGGLLLRSFQELVSRDLGFDPVGVTAAVVTLQGPAFTETDARLAFWQTTLDAVSDLPGVETVGLASPIPTGSGGRGFIDLPGREGDQIGAGYYVVDDGYFETLGVPLLAGRTFDASDGPGTERVAVVNRSMVERFWPDRDPVGQQVRARSMEGYGPGPAPWITVVGVVGDALQYGFESRSEPDMFVLYRQVPYHAGSMGLLVKARPGSSIPADAIRRTVRNIEPSVPVEISSMEARLAAGTEERRLVLSGLGVFGGVGLLLVCLGIYGLMSFAAEARTREMAVRAALGADRSGLMGLMLAGAMRVVVAGALAGVFAAWVFTRLLRSLLVEVRATDPLSYAAAFGLLAAVCVVAAAVPSLRAARQDPLEALRAEG